MKLFLLCGASFVIYLPSLCFFYSALPKVKLCLSFELFRILYVFWFCSQFCSFDFGSNKNKKKNQTNPINFIRKGSKPKGKKKPIDWFYLDRLRFGSPFLKFFFKIFPNFKLNLGLFLFFFSIDWNLTVWRHFSK